MQIINQCQLQGLAFRKRTDSSMSCDHYLHITNAIKADWGIDKYKMSFFKNDIIVHLYNHYLFNSQITQLDLMGLLLNNMIGNLSSLKNYNISSERIIHTLLRTIRNRNDRLSSPKALNITSLVHEDGPISWFKVANWSPDGRVFEYAANKSFIYA